MGHTSGTIIPDPRTIGFPPLLNMACFALAIMKLGHMVSYEGFHWPMLNEKPSVDQKKFGDEWSEWWNDLIEQRAHSVMSDSFNSNDTDTIFEELPKTLNARPILYTVINKTIMDFRRWWAEPYIGGHRALFNSIEPRKIYVFNALETLCAGKWHIDILAPRQGLRQIVFHAGRGWALLHPEDVWNLNWLRPDIIQQQPQRIIL